MLSANGEIKAKELSELEELKNIDAIWSSNYVRAIATAKYIAEVNNLLINIDLKSPSVIKLEFEGENLENLSIVS